MKQSLHPRDKCSLVMVYDIVIYILMIFAPLLIKYIDLFYFPWYLLLTLALG